MRTNNRNFGRQKRIDHSEKKKKTGKANIICNNNFKSRPLETLCRRYTKIKIIICFTENRSDTFPRLIIRLFKFLLRAYVYGNTEKILPKGGQLLLVGS